MNRPEAAGRMVQWAIELSQFDIEYHLRTSIKAQALADFIAEFTLRDEDSLTNEVEQWTIQTDGSSAQRRGGVGVVITTPDGEMLKYGVQLKFSATNNEAEYEGTNGIETWKGAWSQKPVSLKRFKASDRADQGGVQSQGRENAEIPQADETSDLGVRYSGVCTDPKKSEYRGR